MMMRTLDTYWRSMWCVLATFPFTYLSMRLSSSSSSSSPKGRVILDVDFEQITSPLERIKCYCLSDLHADTERNQQWVREKCLRKVEDEGVFTVFLLPGDVGSEVDRLESVFRHLAAQYDAVVFVPGNHEAWRRGIAAGGSATRPEERAENRMAENSVVKLQEVLDCARACGVHVGPLRLQMEGAAGAAAAVGQPSRKPFGAVVVPLYSWYHAGWDKEPELVHPDFLAVESAMPFARKWGDFAMCSWPEDLVSQEEFGSTTADSTVLARAFADINEPFLLPVETPTSISSSISSDSSSSSSRAHDSPIVQDGDSVISFSHFLPRQELCPEKRFLLEPLLTKVVGSDFLEAQVRRLRPHVHLFGHTHIPVDLTIDDVRYIQWPLGYSREADKQCAPVHRIGPLLVFDSALGRGADGVPRDSPSLDSIWSTHYRAVGRDAHNVVDLAPWVLRRLDTFSGFVRSNQKAAIGASAASGRAGGSTAGSTTSSALTTAPPAPAIDGRGSGEDGLITEEDASSEIESPAARNVRENASPARRL